MSGGISAIKGFDYQATVILDRLFEHFDGHGSTAEARPEGTDDLDLSWTADAIEHRRYEQIKKPREDNYGNLKPASWTLSQAVDELFPNTIVNLSGNQYEQVWIVGDMVDEALRLLVAAGENAPTAAAEPYWKVVHLLARNDAVNAHNLEASKRSELLRWRVPADLPANPKDALSKIAHGFAECAKNTGVKDGVAIRFLQKATLTHKCLPGILARIEIQSTYGTEDAVAKRVRGVLAQRYSLQYEVIENTLFRNLRGFINDISKRPGRKFNLEELEFELRSVWPRMIPIKDAPQLDAEHVDRPDLVERFTTGWTGKAIEAVGISGSGKTLLAAEVVKESQSTAPARQVYYAEVRPDVGLRDVMAGVAFHLRRIGIFEPFAISVENGPTDEVVLSNLARLYSVIPQEVLLLVDLVEGTCSPAFARDLATFIRALTSSVFRIAIFGQESALRELNQAEKDALGAGQVDIRGFRFEEFVTLVGHYHPQPDRAALWGVYHRVTAGRAAGLFAKLAQALASAQSMQEMVETAARPAEDTLPYAEQQRFGRITPAARRAAENLVCFALPFRRKDAEEIFSADNVGAAINEMRTLGLLRPHDEDSYEMHETVRAGLEGTIALTVRNSAHQALATWYGAHDLVTAEILHLEKAGQSNEARRRARESFLRGERWAALSAYVTEHKLVSPSEVIRRVAVPKPVEDRYFLTNVLRGLGEPVAVDELFQVLREQPNRFFGDYQWGLAIVEAILEFEPARLEDLIVFSIETMSEAASKESALGCLVIAARRKNCVIGPRTITFFGKQPPEIKKLLLRFLFLDRRRDALRCAFQFLALDQGQMDGSRAFFWSDVALQISCREDAVEFLAAMASVTPAAMLIAKSALLGPLANLVWSQRKALKAYCIEILRDSSMDERLVENAIRVLVFLAEPSICELCDELLARKGAIRGFATLVPALVPACCDCSRYEARLMDGNTAFEDRATALFVLASVGADIGDIYRRVKAAESDSQRSEKLDFLFLTLCAQRPFAEAIPLFDKALESVGEKNAHFLTSVLSKLAELPVPGATALLVRALSSPNQYIRQCAAISLSQRRANTALASLVAHYADERQEVQAVTLATAIVASGTRSVMDLRSTLQDAPATQLWKCILAMRSRDSTFVNRIVALACDPAQNWQLRRAAIFAAGRFPYEAALEKIVPVVLAERSPLAIDQNSSFLCHAVMSSILLSGNPGLAPIFARGRVRFVEFFSEIFEESWNVSMSRQGLPAGAEAAGWLFDRLKDRGWPARQEAPDIVLNELNVPMLHSAVLRSLRLNGKPDVIEEQFSRAYHVWFAMKCLMERSRAGGCDSALASRLKALIEASPCKGSALLDRVINEICVRVANQPVAAPAVASPEAVEAVVLRTSYITAESSLTGANANLQLVAPVVLESLTVEQCEQLIRLADPAKDRHQISEIFIPSIQFTRSSHVVAQRRTTYSSIGDSISTLIRPAVAAANGFGLPISWHHELMAGPLANTYIPKFLACLGARNDSDRFYEELARDADMLLPYICNAAHGKPVLRYIDARIIPYLLRYVSSGADELFEGLCTLALQVISPEIDNVLAGLFYRWTQRFDVRSPHLQHDQNHALWRAFKRLSEHPRFNTIEGWRSRLAVVLSAPISWYHSQEIVRVLERDPRSYILIESRLFKATNWEHFHQDEIDRLDAVAELLFPQLLEN